PRRRPPQRTFQEEGPIGLSSNIEIESSDRGAIVVSGGSRGLGAALVESLLDAGEAVATLRRRPSQRLEALRAHPRLHWECMDATDYAATSTFMRAAEKRFGRIAALVNNAGVGSEGILATVSLQEIKRTLDTNLLAPLQLSKLAASRMLKHRQGCIVNVTS